MSKTTDDDDTQGHRMMTAPGAVDPEATDTEDDEDDTAGHTWIRQDEEPGFSGSIKPDTTMQS
ncbi:MAG TPA: hypothetical protein VJ831_01575 [Jatrophihabitantaceae bacterium]|nr:hypothetical protein [Jatrophihabitantaceae bacterium]